MARCQRCGGLKRPVCAAVDICYCDDDELEPVRRTYDADELGIDQEDD